MPPYAVRVQTGACNRRRVWVVRASGQERGRSSGVEHNLAKVGVEGSNPFARSIEIIGFFGISTSISSRNCRGHTLGHLEDLGQRDEPVIRRCPIFDGAGHHREIQIVRCGAVSHDEVAFVRL
jgi:hypothetical protein